MILLNIFIGCFMLKNTSVTLGSHFDQFITSLVADGRYGSTSDAIRAGLRLLEEREAKLIALRQALKEGEDSGKANYNLDSLIKELDKE
jgi:antitoxin ParD1/3/4